MYYTSMKCKNTSPPLKYKIQIQITIVVKYKPNVKSVRSEQKSEVSMPQKRPSSSGLEIFLSTWSPLLYFSDWKVHLPYWKVYLPDWKVHLSHWIFFHQTEKFFYQTENVIFQTEKFIHQIEKFIYRTEKFIYQTEKFIYQT